ncbi:MAG: GAF domain-containing protein, partial [Chloroflexota bacterium]|nr:GAF domain-containing protein [Chloroflexota bacterium]
MIESFLNFWEQLVEPSQDIDAEVRPLSRVLNGVLVILIVAGGIAQTEFLLRSHQTTVSDLIVIAIIISFAVAYVLNRKGYFLTAVSLLLGAFILGIFATDLFNPNRENGSLIVFYLIIPIMMAEFFLSLRSYALVAALILWGLLSLVSLSPARVNIFFFFLIFASLVGVGSSNRRRIHRQRQASLRESEERYRSVISAMTEGIVVHSRDGAIETSNDSADIILGLTPDPLNGRSSPNPLWRAIHKDGSDFPAEEHPAMVTLRTGRSQMGVVMGIRRPNGSLTWLSVNTQPLFQFDETYPSAVVTTFTDITREHNLLADEMRHARQMKLLNEIMYAALEILDFKQMVQSFADKLAGLLESDGTYITLWDDEKELTIPAAAYGIMRATYPSASVEPGETTLTASVLRSGHPLAIDDVLNTSYLSPRIAALLPAHSVLALPLIVRNEKLGAVLIAFNQAHTFSMGEIAICEQATRQVALAIFKAQVFEAEHRRVSQLGLLEEASRQIAGLLDEREICWQVMQTIVRSFGYAEAAILLTVENGDLELIAIGGTEDMGFSPGLHVKKGQGIIGHTAVSRDVYITGDVSRDPYYATPPRGPRTGSAIGLPMLHERDLLGVLYIESTTPDDFDTEIVHTFQTLTSHTVTAIQRARLFAVARDQLRAITAVQAVSQTVSSSLELEQIFQTVVETLQNTFGYNFVSIYLLDGEVLRLGAEIGYPPDQVYKEILITNGVAGRAVKSGQVQFIPDVAREPGFLRASHEVESEICVPLLKEGTVLGVLNIESERGHPLTETDITTLTSFAGQVAVAVDNARLHGQVKSLALTDGLT